MKCLPPRLTVNRQTRVAVPVYEEARGSSAQRGYDYAWQKARIAWLHNHPLCVFCEKAGMVVEANVVDHIIPHKGDKFLFWDSENNWQSLCAPCHDITKKRIENNG